MDVMHALDGTTRGVMLVSGIGWAVITFRLLWRARLAGTNRQSGEVALPIVMSIAAVLWSLADAMAWADMESQSARISTLSVAVRIAAGVAVAASTLRFAWLSSYLETELLTHRIVDAALDTKAKNGDPDA